MQNIDKILEIVSDTIGIDKAELSSDSAMDSTEGWDSLAHVQIISEFEAAFDISVPFEKIVEVKSVADLAALLG